MVRLTLRLDRDVVAQCEQLALERGITLNEFISKLITEYINTLKAQND